MARAKKDTEASVKADSVVNEPEAAGTTGQAAADVPVDAEDALVEADGAADGDADAPADVDADVVVDETPADVDPIEEGDEIDLDEEDDEDGGVHLSDETVKLKGLDEELEVYVGPTGGRYVDPDGAFHVKLTDPPVDICKDCGATHGHTQFKECQVCGFAG